MRKHDGALEVESFEWIYRSILGEAGCVTLIEAGDPAAVVRAFGGRMEEARRLSAEEIGEVFGGEPSVAVRRQGDWVIAIEDNGWQGSRTEVLRRVCEETRAVSAFWNVNAVTRFSYAADGRLLTGFDALTPEWRDGDDPDCLEETRDGLPWQDDRRVALVLALAARVTGQQVSPEWLAGEFDVAPVTSWEEDVQEQVYFEYEPLTYEAPVLGYALRNADAPALRRAARAAAAYVAGAAQLTDHPVVSDALRSGGGEALDRLLRSMTTEAERQVRRADQRDPGIGRAWLPVKAVEAVRALRARDPLAAAFCAVGAAYSGMQYGRQDPSGLREQVLGALGSPCRPTGSGRLAAPATGTPAERYAWITRHWLAPAARISYVRTTDTHAVARAFGGDPAQARTGPVPLTDDSWYDAQVALQQRGEWMVAIQFGGIGLCDTSLLERLSAGSSAVCAAWSLRGNAMFYYAAGGRMRTALRAGTPGDATGDDPGALREIIAGLGLPLQDTPPAVGLLALAERITGVALTPAHLDADNLILHLPAFS
ncbi:MAG: DUF6461 domain-containing protein [Trebonia sp.]